MKIALLGHSKHPLKEPFAGGLEMILYALAENLLQRNISVDVYALEGSDPKLNVKALKSIEPVLEKKPFQSSEKEFLNEHFTYSEAIRKIKEGNYDLVHNHSMHYLPLTEGKNFPIPFLTTFHVPPFPLIQLGLELRGKQPGNDYFSFVSKNLSKQFEGLLEEHSIIYNGISTEFWKPTTRKIETNLVMWYGRICKEKAPHLAIEAAIKANKKIIVAGPISNTRYYQKYIEKSLAHPNVIYKGHLTQVEIRNYLQISSVCLFTSVWEEPFGLTLVEALACGTPVIAWKKGAATEIIDDTCGILIPDVCTNSMAAAISVAQNLNRNKCREKAVQFFSIDNMVTNYIRLYQHLIKHHQIKNNVLI